MSDGLKVCFITKMYPPRTGGGATYAYELANALGELGHDVDVYAVGPRRGQRRVHASERERHADHEGPTAGRVLDAILLDRVSVPDRLRGYDVIHGTLMPASTIALGPQFLAGLDAPLVLTSHGTSYDEARAVDPQSPPDYLFSTSFTRSTSPWTRWPGAVRGPHYRRERPHARAAARPVSVRRGRLDDRPAGIDADRFQPTDEVHPAIDTDRESILVLSRLDPRKGSTRRSGRSHSLNGRTQSC